MADGLTVIEEVVSPPGDHRYESAPDAVAVNVTLSPGQMVSLFTATVMTVLQLIFAVPKKFIGTLVV